MRTLSCIILMSISKTINKSSKQENISTIYNHSVLIFSEEECDEVLFYKCSSGECITRSELCDYHDDCGDGSDEMGCREYTNIKFKYQIILTTLYPYMIQGICLYITMYNTLMCSENKLCIRRGWKRGHFLTLSRDFRFQPPLPLHRYNFCPVFIIYACLFFVQLVARS